MADGRVLAIEGNKKLDAVQQELFDAFSACYSKVNGRDVETFQPHEMIMLCNDATFFDLIEIVRSEIEKLSGEKTEEVKNIDGVAELAQARGLHLEDGIEMETLKEPIVRTMLLGELLADLQACRLISKKVYTSELNLVLTDSVEKACKPLIEELAQAFGIKVGSQGAKGGKGAYKGKAAKEAAAAGGDEKSQALEKIADAVAGDQDLCGSWPEHLLFPEWSLSGNQERGVKNIMELFNKEYTTRRKVLTRRLDVTIQAFLWSSKADQCIVQMSQAIAAVMEWRDKLGAANIGLYDVFCADYNAVQDKGKVSSIFSLQSVVKSVIIGAVPDRGGVPEGYTVEDITKDVVKANVALTKKDAGGGGGKGGAAQAAAALAAKRWIGKGMGAGSDEPAAAQPSGGAFYSKGGGKGGKKDGGSKGGGGGGYYSQQSSGGGGGGYYGGGGGGKSDKGGGGGYYNQQSDSGGGGYDGGGKGKGGGGKGKKGGGGGGGGGGFYAQQAQNESSDGGGGGGGFYAQQQQQQQGGGGGFYAQQGGGGGGGFYAQQQDASPGGGFYAQQQGGGGFYNQQQTGGGGGFYAQQGGGGGGGGFYGQQGGGGGGFYGQQGGGGGFYDQQGGGGGGFYAQQGGGGGGFYAQQGGGGKGGGRGGGGGWGGRNSDLPPTAKGWSKGGR